MAKSGVLYAKVKSNTMKSSKHTLYFVLGFLSIFSIFSLTSCNSKKGVIDDLRNLRTEIREHGEEYSQKDWDDVNNEFAEIHERLEEYELNSREIQLVDDLDAEIATYQVRYNAGGLVDSFIGGVAKIIDDIAGANTSQIAQSITRETHSAQRQIERKAEQTIWKYVLWGLCIPCIIGVIVYVISSLTKGGRTRRSRKVRSSYRTGRYSN